jgi:hypothetical protein
MFEDFYKNYEVNNVKKSLSKVSLIIISPWMFTSVPWFAITLGLLLNDKKIYVEFLWDDLEIDEISSEIKFSSRIQNFFIKSHITFLSKHFIIHKLSSFSSSKLDKRDLEELDRLSKINTIHKQKSVISSSINKNYTKKWYNHQLKNFSIIKFFFNNHKFNTVVMPGGVYGNTGLYYYMIENKNSICTFDSGLDRLIFCINGITGYQHDVPVVVSDKSFLSISNIQYDYIKKISLDELESRIKGTDTYNTQLISSQKNFKLNFDVVIPLNITWDLPALGKHRFFENDCDWVIETVDYILKNSNCSIAVRQHPHERNHTSGRDFEKLLNEKFSKYTNFKFFNCSEKINTYDLINGAKVVLPYVSTIGIEAALMGKCVIIESDNYYSNFSFVYKSTSKLDYFERILKELNFERHKISNLQYKDAILTYYITQLCTAEITSFTPFVENFKSWVLLDFNKLQSNSSVKLILNAIINNIPVALQKHNNFIKNIN